MAEEAASERSGRWTDEAFARLSLAAAVATLGLKLAAWRLTGSVGFFTDALETGVNFSAALFALFILRVARRPPDTGHDFGHSKAEYFSSGFEGGLILFAAISMAAAAFERLLHPRPVLELGIGLLLSSSALLVNLAVGATLVHAGRQRRSIVLEADGEHLLTDVWTSVGVIAGVALCGTTGWTVLDPLTALAACAVVGLTGIRLVRRSVQGLLDAALDPGEVAAIALELERYAGKDVRWHALRTRQSGTRKFATFHLLVPGGWTVHQGHALCEHLEGVLAVRIPGLVVQIHVEPIEDPESWMDQNLDHTPAVALSCSLDPPPTHGHPPAGKGRFALLARWARLFRRRRRGKGL